MNNEFYMREALREAEKARKKDEVPIGAVIVRGGKIIARGRNKREHGHNATAHAEIEAIKKACRRLRDFRLNNCDIYVTLEPCLMCAGAIINARIRHVFFGAGDDGPAARGAGRFYAENNLNHSAEVTGGILKQECEQILKEFFKSKRRQ